MLTNVVCCVRFGHKYDDYYIRRLYNMVRANVSIPFDFVCFSNKEIPGINTLPLMEEEEMWNKMRILGSPHLQKYTTKTYFDLDVVIQQNIDAILQHETQELSLIRSLWKPSDILRTNPTDTLFNSGVMVWKDASDVYNHYTDAPDKTKLKYKATDRFLWHEPLNVKVLPPGWIYSYKHGASMVDSEPFVYRPDFLVAILHGFPKPHELSTDDPLRRVWESYD